jgi:hypothetical protein
MSCRLLLPSDSWAAGCAVIQRVSSETSAAITMPMSCSPTRPSAVFAAMGGAQLLVLVYAA